LAVHSLKDLPTEVVPGLALAATPPRGPVGDVLLAREGQTLAEMPEGSRIGTGSPRRRAQLWHARPDLKMLDVRGNVDTRLAKLLHGGEYDALVLAEAGVTRLELASTITERLPPELILPAVGQGALGIEARSDDDACRAQLDVLNDPATWSAVTAERTLLAALRGGCLAPLGAWGRIVDQELRLTAVVLSPDGRQRLFAEAAERPEAAIQLGQRVATALREQGSDALLQAARAR
jgi:hydroxymethylbilane synthase